MDNSRAFTVDVKSQVRALGGTFMKSEQARRDSNELGLAGFPYYFAGRGGVLGRVDADDIASFFPFFPPEFVRIAWYTAGERVSPAEAAVHYTETCRSWGRAKLGDLPAAERLAELLALVVDATEATGLALFAGWRAVALPDDPPGRVAQLAHVLREHRGGMHSMAVAAGGLTPLQAVLTRDHGPSRARFLRWPEPYPELGDDARRRRLAIEERTDDLAAPAYAVLDDAQGAELRHLLGQAYLHSAGQVVAR